MERTTAITCQCACRQCRLLKRLLEGVLCWSPLATKLTHPIISQYICTLLYPSISPTPSFTHVLLPLSLASSPITNGWWSSLRCNKTAQSRGSTALLMTLLGEVCFIIHPSLSTLTSCLTLLPIVGGGNSLLRLCCYRSSLVVSTVRTCLRSRGPSYRVFVDIACSRGATAGEREGERGSV